MRKRNIFGALFILLVLYFGKTINAPPSDIKKIPTPSSILSFTTARVVRVVDGDTIELENGQKVRYIGVDTPEVKDPRKPVQCFGEAASEKNKELVLRKEIRLEKDVSETDTFGRLLRYVYVGDIFVNEYLVREGYAYAATFPPDVKHQAVLQEAQEIARQGKKGLWLSCNPS